MVFKKYKFDVNSILPKKWDTLVVEYAIKNAQVKIIEANSVTSREENKSTKIETMIVDGVAIKKDLPWLFKLYKNTFLSMANSISKEKLYTAENDIYGINLNIQIGSKMRYECHVDSNPLQGLLFATNHPLNSGGELVISNQENVAGIEQIDQNAEIIYPEIGCLYFFDATKNPHYVRSLKFETDIRVSIPMNFYSESNPESKRPLDLNNHLFNLER